MNLLKQTVPENQKTTIIINSKRDKHDFIRHFSHVDSIHMEEEINSNFKHNLEGATIETKQVINQLLKSPHREVALLQIETSSRPDSRGKQASSRQRKRRQILMRNGTLNNGEKLRHMIKREISFRLSNMLNRRSW